MDLDLTHTDQKNKQNPVEKKEKPKQIKGSQIGKEEIKLSIYMWHDIVYRIP